jgi:predicted 3-demethylubiquinone-9 3-methyltransferase (glyoxalase superfamily)
MNGVTPCLWFDTEGEDAANFYTSVFPNSKIVHVSRYGSAGPRPEGTVMTVEFELDGSRFTALNGGPDFTFNEAVSLHVSCESQDEVDAYWSALSRKVGRRARAGGSRTGSASHGRSTPSDSRSS